MASTTRTDTKKAKLSKPAPLRPSHILSEFDCGESVLNVWLTKRALPAMASRTANTFVVCCGKRVVGYYSLATGAIFHADCTSNLRQNTPDPVPIIVLARLAVDKSEQAAGIGGHLVQDAMRRTLAAARHVAARTLVVHALNDRVVGYYKRLGFLELPVREGARALHLKLETIAASLSKPTKSAA